MRSPLATPAFPSLRPSRHNPTEPVVILPTPGSFTRLLPCCCLPFLRAGLPLLRPPHCPLALGGMVLAFLVLRAPWGRAVGGQGRADGDTTTRDSGQARASPRTRCHARRDRRSPGGRCSVGGRRLHVPGGTIRGGAGAAGRDAGGRGAWFWLSDEGRRLHYNIHAENLADVRFSYICLGRPGENILVVLTLSAAQPGPIDDIIGVVAPGAEDLQGPLAGRPVADVPAALYGSTAYVDVHTVAFPGGGARAGGSGPLRRPRSTSLGGTLPSIPSITVLGGR